MKRAKISKQTADKTVTKVKELAHDASLEVLNDLSDFAKEQGLRYVKDDQPGFKRVKKGKGFTYLDHENFKITHDKTLQRIQTLVIPPAWDGVWICRFGNGHLQATGRDVKTRKQYRYHNQWTEKRNETKFEKLLNFGESLDIIRSQVDSDLRTSGLSKKKVLAAVIQIMEKTNIRIGNDIYAEDNDSYGLTTLRNDQTEVKGNKIHFEFKGKSGVFHDVSFADPKLSRIIQKCQDLPGEELFCYEDDKGISHDIGSSDVNEYLKNLTGSAITAKDFRTWAGTVHALKVLISHNANSEQETQLQRKRRHLEVFKMTAKTLRNTVAVCRKYYVHPLVFDAEEKNILLPLHKKVLKRAQKQNKTLYSNEELLLLELLKEI